MWLKYSDRPILLGEQWDREQCSDLDALSKPCGFWITDDSEYCWRSWCIAERFVLDLLTHKHEIELEESNILFLRSVNDLDRFTYRYSVEKWVGRRRNIIDWPRVAKEYSGIIITPYQWSRRMHDSCRWYYLWDCASGCIWQASAIKAIRLIDIDYEVAKKED